MHHSKCHFCLQKLVPLRLTLFNYLYSGVKSRQIPSTCINNYRQSESLVLNRGTFLYDSLIDISVHPLFCYMRQKFTLQRISFFGVILFCQYQAL